MRFDLQKASLGKRLPAWLLDAILLVILATAVAALLSFVFGYDAYGQQLQAAYDKYETIYGVDFELTQEAIDKLTDEQMQQYQQAFDALNKDADAVRAYTMVMSLTLLILSLSILVSYVLLEFLVPLWLGNGQTVGKKIFNIALMRPDGVKVTTFMMFVRTILGKYTFETMVPVLILTMMYFNMVGLEGTIVLGLFLLIQVVLLLANRTRSVVHDLLACTVVVDNASQMMFDTPEALLEYQKRIHAEETADSDY